MSRIIIIIILGLLSNSFKFVIAEEKQNTDINNFEKILTNKNISHIQILQNPNDVEDGGETNFSHYGVRIKQEIGKTLIWPAEWTHAHTGKVLNSGVKYIITGWMHFPRSKKEI